MCGDDEMIGRGKPYPDIFLNAVKHGLGWQFSDEGRAILEKIRDPGAEFDGKLGGVEGEILVFEDALVREYNGKLTLSFARHHTNHDHSARGPSWSLGWHEGYVFKPFVFCTANNAVVWVPDPSVRKNIMSLDLAHINDSCEPWRIKARP